MEYILVLLIVALLNGAIAYIDGLMEGIIPLTLYAEQYMSTLAGVDLFQSLFDIVFGFGVSLIVLKFLKKGFETYVLWSDGDADEEPIAILTNFFKAMAVAICFPTMYDWLATIVEEMSNKMLEAIGLATAYDWAGWVSGISSMGLVTAIFGLVFVIVYFILYRPEAAPWLHWAYQQRKNAGDRCSPGNQHRHRIPQRKEDSQCMKMTAAYSPPEMPTD